MNPRLLFLTLMAILSLILVSSCSSANKEDELTKAPVETVKNDIATLEFDEGEAKLSEMDRLNLNELAIKAASEGKVVDDIKILTWADRKIANENDATNSEIILAKRRADAIKKYIQINLPAEEDIVFYNMAESPERYSNFLKRKGISVEQALNEGGKVNGQDGRGLVIIEYQNYPAPSIL